MGYFPLPELKGKPNRIFVDGKTLNQIAKESGIRLDTVQHIPLQTISDKTGISRSTIYAFLYNGTDLSSMRLAKICSLLGLSMDYVMGLKEKPDGKM